MTKTAEKTAAKTAELGEVILGDTVKDPISGVEGIAVCRLVWIHGCDMIKFQPIGCDEKKLPFDGVTVDEQQLIIVKKVKPKKEKDTTGGFSDFRQPAKNKSELR